MSNPNQPTPHGPIPSDPQQPQPPYGQPPYGQSPYGQPPHAPVPEPKKRSWFARHKISTAVLAIAGIAVVGAALGGGDDDATPAPPSPTVAAGAPTDAGSPDVSQEAGEPAPAEEAPAEEAPAGEAVAGIGENVEVGDFAITVTGVEAAIQRVGSEMFGEDPQGQFVTVALTVTNNGNSAEYFFDSGQKLVDEQGREHSSSSAVMYLEDNNLLITQINPGNSASGMLLYDIPVDATPVQIQLSSGLFGRGVVVALG